MQSTDKESSTYTFNYKYTSRKNQHVRIAADLPEFSHDQKKVTLKSQDHKHWTLEMNIQHIPKNKTVQFLVYDYKAHGYVYIDPTPHVLDPEVHTYSGECNLDFDKAPFVIKDMLHIVDSKAFIAVYADCMKLVDEKTFKILDKFPVSDPETHIYPG